MIEVKISISLTLLLHVFLSHYVIFAARITSFAPRFNDAVFQRTRLCLNDSVVKFDESTSIVMQKRPLQIIDASLLFDEIELLEIRLYELQDVVDYFIIIEQNETHTGRAKELVYDKHYTRLEQKLGIHLMRKIIYYECVYPPELRIEIPIIGKSPQQALHWKRENYARNVCTRDALFRLKPKLLPTALLLQSDIDEIPDAFAVASFKYCKYETPAENDPFLVAFGQVRYHFNFHCASSNMYYWTGTMLATVEYALSVGLQKFRDMRQSHIKRRVPHGWGGWHFSNSPFGDANKLVRKYTAFTETQTIDHVKDGDLLAYWVHTMSHGGDAQSNTHCEEHELHHLPRLVRDLPLAYKDLLTKNQFNRLFD